MIDLEFKYREAVKLFLKEAPFEPELAVILGSGLGNFADTLQTIHMISNEDLPGYPPATVPGHSGQICFSRHSGVNILLFKGRVHFYEGSSLSQCVLPVLLARKAGTKFLLITNAAGGVNPLYHPGDLMLAGSFNGIYLKKELTALLGLSGVEQKNYFNHFPSTELNTLISAAARKSGINLHTGTYWYTKGPSYETPAEIRMIGKYGGDAVGMSTVHEAVFAASIGLKVSAVSCITNYASGISGQKLSHSEVTLTAKLVEKKFSTLITQTISSVGNTAHL